MLLVVASKHLRIRSATRDDLATIVSLTRAKRRQLARWAPVSFNPSKSADEMHQAFLEFIVDSKDHVTQALISGDETVVGFYVELPLAGGPRVWIDDLCLVDAAWWPTAVRVINEATSSSWLTCVSAQDSAQADALLGNGQRILSSWWARPTHGIDPVRPPDFDLVDFDATVAAVHTFGVGAFRPEQAGALVVGTADGFIIGSPSTTTPIYDPGGPTTVIDQVNGPNRSKILDLALAAAAERGDAQVIVVCSAHDAELSTIVGESGFNRTIDLIGR